MVYNTLFNNLSFLGKVVLNCLSLGMPVSRGRLVAQFGLVPVMAGLGLVGGYWFGCVLVSFAWGDELDSGTNLIGCFIGGLSFIQMGVKPVLPVYAGRVALVLLIVGILAAAGAGVILYRPGSWWYPLCLSMTVLGALAGYWADIKAARRRGDL